MDRDRQARREDRGEAAALRRWQRGLAPALALTLTLSACGGRRFDGFPGDPGEEDRVSGVFNGEIRRADLDYADMEVGGMSEGDFEALIADFDRLAEEGGTAGAFESAESALRDGLYRLYTDYVLLRNASYANAGDAELSRLTDEALGTYYDAFDAYMLAHRRMAGGEHRRLLEDVFSGDYIAYFESYEPSGDEEDELSGEESALISRYYALAGDVEGNAAQIGEIFVRLVKLRRDMARLSGYDSYAALAYDGFYARSYSPEDARSVWQAARQRFAPLAGEAAETVGPSAEALEEDASFDCSEARVLEAVCAMAGELSPELGAAGAYLTGHHLYDIAPSPQKARIGFTVFLPSYNEPFIFNAPSGTFYDYTDLAHEFGHFVNDFYNPPEPLFGLADNDLTELQSQGMSVVMSFLFADIFGRSRGDVMRDCVLLDLAVSVADGAMYDEFQQRVFEEADLTPARVDEIFREIYLSYGYEPYEGYEHEWMEVAHNFESPFYYISYAVSALGALEINRRCEEDFRAGLETFLKVLSMDPELWYYTEALEEAGLSDVFDGSIYEDIASALARSLDAGLSPAA